MSGDIQMKRMTLVIFCAFAAIIIFFSVFGSIIRQSLYVPVTTAKSKIQYGDFNPRRVVPNEAVHDDDFNGSYVWVLYEADDIGEKYYYAGKISVEILDRNDIYTYLAARSLFNGFDTDPFVIVTAGAELQDKTRVKISGEYGE